MNNQKITKQIQDGFMNAFNFSSPKVNANFKNHHGTIIVSRDSDTETDVIESVKGAIEQIHSEFNTAGDKLLVQALNIIENTKASNPEKAEKLHKLGFHNTGEGKEYMEVINITDKQKKIAEAISFFKIQYPNYKFITHNIAIEICEKYNLVLGDVSKFKGFVPLKNIEEIENFSKLHSNEFDYYQVSDKRTIFISEKLFEETLKKCSSIKDVCYPLDNKGGMYANGYYKQKTNLRICAPVKDMVIKANEYVQNRQIVSYPDPVVMKGIAHENGVWGFLILTAWGDEASDELVVNQNNN